MTPGAPNQVLDRLLIGDNSFIGVDHLSQERIREKESSLDEERISRVIGKALESGAQGLMCSAHPNMSRVLRRMKTQKYSRAFGVYLIVPDVQSYVRIASEKGMPGLIGDMMGRLGVAGKAKALLGGSLSALNRNPVSAMRTYLDAETSGFIGAMPKRCELRSLIMHELFTELVVSFKLQDLALAYVEHVKDSMNVLPGFATRNFARFVDFASEAGLPMKELVILAPFNKVGFQMNPSREECEAKLAQIGETNVIAMSILASGFLGLQESVDYIRKLPKPVSCVVGVSSEVHAQETFSLLRRSFSTHS